MALKFTVHVVQSFIKGHRKSGVISIKHSMANQITYSGIIPNNTFDCHTIMWLSQVENEHYRVKQLTKDCHFN